MDTYNCPQSVAACTGVTVDTYKIVRFYRDGSKRPVTIETGLSLEEAQAHCNDPETSSKTATSKAGKQRTRLHGPWFDGYQKE